MANLDNTDGEEAHKKYMEHLMKLQARLKQTSDKDKIMKESRELFYDETFIEKQDSKPYLLGLIMGCMILKKVF